MTKAKSKKPNKVVAKKSVKTTSQKKSNKNSLKAQGLDKVHHDENGCPTLTTEQLLTWRLAMAESELAKKEWQLQEKDLEIYLKGLTEYNVLKGKALGLHHTFQKKSQAYMTTLDKLSGLIGLDIKQCIINDATGKLTFLDKDGKITPDAPVLGKT